MASEPSTAELASRASFDRFTQFVVTDDALHRALRETPDVDSFIALAVELGRKRGCPFTADVVRTAMQEKRQDWLQRWV